MAEAEDVFGGEDGKMDCTTARVDQNDYTKEYYEFDCDRYGSGHSFISTRIERVMSFLEPGSGFVVADIACGIGTFSLELAPRAKWVYAVDFSQDALDAVSRLQKEQGYKNIIPIRCSVDDMYLEDGVVDTIVSADLVEHLYDDQFKGFAAECRRILKPGGYMIIYTPAVLTDFKKKAKKFYGPIKNVIFKLMGARPISEAERQHNEEYEFMHVCYRPIEDIISTLKENGFTIEKTKYFGIPAPFPISRMKFIRGNFAKRYLIKCRRK